MLWLLLGWSLKILSDWSMDGELRVMEVSVWQQSLSLEVPVNTCLGSFGNIRATYKRLRCARGKADKDL